MDKHQRKFLETMLRECPYYDKCSFGGEDEQCLLGNYGSCEQYRRYVAIEMQDKERENNTTRQE